MATSYEQRLSKAELDRIQRERIAGEEADYRRAEKQYSARGQGKSGSEGGR